MYLLYVAPSGGVSSSCEEVSVEEQSQALNTWEKGAEVVGAFCTLSTFTHGSVEGFAVSLSLTWGRFCYSLGSEALGSLA